MPPWRGPRLSFGELTDGGVVACGPDSDCCGSMCMKPPFSDDEEGTCFGYLEHRFVVDIVSVLVSSETALGMLTYTRPAGSTAAASRRGDRAERGRI